jgi:murein DD-endopeptidase MepM/ murein hydrolase activator NlpD
MGATKSAPSSRGNLGFKASLDVVPNFVVLIFGSLFLKTAITQNVRVPSSAPHGKNLDSLMAITVVETKQRVFSELSQYYTRHAQPQKLVMGLAMAVGTSSLVMLASLHTIVVNKWPTMPTAAASQPSLPIPAVPQQQPLIATIASKTKLAAAKPVTPKVVVKKLSAIPIVEPINLAAVVAPIPQSLPDANAGGVVRPIALPINYANVDDFIYPLTTPTNVGSPFGWRIHPISGQQRLHAGIDFEAPEGAPIVAAIAGRVITAGWQQGYGKTVVIERGGKLQALYGHMSNIMVQVGQEVMPGTVIGAVGSTGQSTGAHLHFEILAPSSDAKRGWTPVDPTESIQYALNNLQQAMLQSSQRSIVPGG